MRYKVSLFEVISTYGVIITVPESGPNAGRICYVSMDDSGEIRYVWPDDNTFQQYIANEPSVKHIVTPWASLDNEQKRWITSQPYYSDDLMSGHQLVLHDTSDDVPW